MNETEHQLRETLGIPETARYVLILDQTAHMDWDWKNTFEGYFSYVMPKPEGSGAGVNQLLTEAMQLLESSSATNPYYYSICEMGFFRKFISTQLEQGIDIVSKIHAMGSFLRIVGGGITSPDCLLSSGESFLRNYLLGKLWLAKLFPELLPLKHCWLPDDFGQDPELPVAVKAMGMTSISFSRLPGIPPSAGILDTALEMDFIRRGADFYWLASDQASSVFTHWMTGAVPGYYQGGDLASSDGIQSKIVSAIQGFLQYANVDLSTYTPPFSAAPSNYVYMPLDEDFMYPIADLLQYVNTWNTSGETCGVFGVEASYDDFVSLVLASGTALETVPYNGTPYWTGFYASRPELKIMHYGATRALLAAEVVGLLVSGAGGAVSPGTLPEGYWDLVSHAWHTLAPSTHHDYICGTAPDSVTDQEQIPVLELACKEARQAVEAAMDALLAAVSSPDGSVVIVNASGTKFRGVVELPAPAPPGMQSILYGSTSYPVQPTFEGGVVFPNETWSAGYDTAELSSATASTPSPSTIASSGGNSYTLRNEFLTVTVSADANWGISSIQDSSGADVLKKNATGNDLIFYVDQGNLYQFGIELPGAVNQAFVPATLIIATSGTSPSGAQLGATVLEQGPVRVRLKTVVSISVPDQTAQDYTREYCLAMDEPFLRMTTSGAAPSPYSVMVGFPLAHPVDSIVYGTPCHWTARQPHQFWVPPIFRPTHNFVLPQANGAPLAPVYQTDVPAWAFDRQGTLLGCILRNTPGTQRGAHGSDSGVHTLHYALRSPVGATGAVTGQPLREATNFSSPPMARIVPSNRSGSLPLRSAGTIAEIGSPGFILAAKPSDVTPGAMILRLYHPTNAPETLLVRLGRGEPASAVAVTALEDPITDTPPLIGVNPNGFTLAAVTALNTVQISFT